MTAIAEQVLDLFDRADPPIHAMECSCGLCIKRREERRALENQLRCSTCKATERNASPFCSNGFHCCRVCKWDEGKIVELCFEHAQHESLKTALDEAHVAGVSACNSKFVEIIEAIFKLTRGYESSWDGEKHRPKPVWFSDDGGGCALTVGIGATHTHVGNLNSDGSLRNLYVLIEDIHAVLVDGSHVMSWSIPIQADNAPLAIFPDPFAELYWRTEPPTDAELEDKTIVAWLYKQVDGTVNVGCNPHRIPVQFAGAGLLTGFTLRADGARSVDQSVLDGVTWCPIKTPLDQGV